MIYRVSYFMDEIWERAVETALDGETDHVSVRTLTLDGAVKCFQGRLPPPSLLERFQNLGHLSIANIGVSSLEQFPRLSNLQKLILSDNRIAGGLEFLVQAGLDSLRDLDLSNNRIQFIEDLVPLAQLKLVSLDLYECPVTRVKDYRSRVFGLINSLKYLDKTDAEENERPESDDEDEDDEEEEDDPGSGEIDGEDRPLVMTNGHREGVDGVVDVDEDEESEADEEEAETSRRVNGLNQENGFRTESMAWDEEDKDDEEEEEEEDEIDEEEGDDDEEDDDDDDVVEVHEIVDSDDDEDGVEFDEDDDDEEEVDNDDVEFVGTESTRLLTSVEGEIDGHEQGEDDEDEYDNGETGEDEIGVEYEVESGDDDEDDEEEEDYGAGYLVQPVGQSETVSAGDASMNGGDDQDDDDGDEDDDDEEEEEEEVDDDNAEVLPPTSPNLKRKRDDDGDEDGGSDEQ